MQRHSEVLRKAEQLCAEVEEGNREYKFKLTNLNKEQLKHRTTQMNWRLNEGHDVAYYLIGVEDNGNQLGISEEEMNESLSNLKYIADQVDSDMSVVQFFSGAKGITAEVLIRRRQRRLVRVSQVGEQAGYSTVGLF
jgi:elongation factor 1-alpha